VDCIFEVNNTIFKLVRRVAGECFEVEFLKKEIYKSYAKKDVNIYIHWTRQDDDKGRLTAMPSWIDGKERKNIMVVQPHKNKVIERFFVRGEGDMSNNFLLLHIIEGSLLL
jgi:hypothetical protein